MPKIDEMRYIAKLTNATITGLSETKLDSTVLSSELVVVNSEYFYGDFST